MLTRRGFTMVELLISIVVLSIVGMATMRVMRGVLNTTRAQVATASTQTNVRTGMLALPQELREVGYDTIPLTGGVVSDLEAIAPHRVTFRAMRGLGVTCGTPSLSQFVVRRPITGIRMPLLTDGFLLFVESDPNQGLDDQWVSLNVTAVDTNATCGGGEPAIALTLGSAPLVDPVNGVPMAISQYFVGGPIRWYERVEYGPYADPATGLAWLGARSLSLGQTSLTPVFGPLPDTTSFTLDYRGTDMAVLNPATAPPSQVRAIRVTLTGTTDGPVSLAGSTNRNRAQTTFSTLVALRNTLRP